jgi:hypothetical protein
MASAYATDEAQEIREFRKAIRQANIGVQANWDPIYQKLGTRARAPVEGEDHWQYRADMAVQAKNNLPITHPLTGNLRLRSLARQRDKTAFLNFEKQCVAVNAYAGSNDSAPEGGLREIVERDANGMEVRKFLGTRCFVADMGRPGRRVVSFKHGPWSSRRWRQVLAVTLSSLVRWQASAAYEIAAVEARSRTVISCPRGESARSQS